MKEFSFPGQIVVKASSQEEAEKLMEDVILPKIKENKAVQSANHICIGQTRGFLGKRVHVLERKK